MEIIMKVKILRIAFVFVFISCTSIKSGHFVKLQEGESFKSVAKTYSVSRYDLERENVDKSFTPGEWIFVPEEKGILPQLLSRVNSSWSLLGHQAFIWPVPSSSRVSSQFGTRWGRHGLRVAIMPKRWSSMNVLWRLGARSPRSRMRLIRHNVIC